MPPHALSQWGRHQGTGRQLGKRKRGGQAPGVQSPRLAIGRASLWHHEGLRQLPSVSGCGAGSQSPRPEMRDRWWRPVPMGPAQHGGPSTGPHLPARGHAAASWRRAFSLQFKSTRRAPLRSHASGHLPTLLFVTAAETPGHLRSAQEAVGGRPCPEARPGALRSARPAYRLAQGRPSGLWVASTRPVSACSLPGPAGHGPRVGHPHGAEVWPEPEAGLDPGGGGW